MLAMELDLVEVQITRDKWNYNLVEVVESLFCSRFHFEENMIHVLIIGPSFFRRKALSIIFWKENFSTSFRKGYRGTKFSF